MNMMNRENMNRGGRQRGHFSQRRGRANWRGGYSQNKYEQLHKYEPRDRISDHSTSTSPPPEWDASFYHQETDEYPNKHERYDRHRDHKSREQYDYASSTRSKEYNGYKQRRDYQDYEDEREKSRRHRHNDRKHDERRKRRDGKKHESTAFDRESRESKKRKPEDKENEEDYIDNPPSDSFKDENGQNQPSEDNSKKRRREREQPRTQSEKKNQEPDDVKVDCDVIASILGDGVVEVKPPNISNATAVVNSFEKRKESLDNTSDDKSDSETLMDEASISNTKISTNIQNSKPTATDTYFKKNKPRVSLFAKTIHTTDNDISSQSRLEKNGSTMKKATPTNKPEKTVTKVKPNIFESFSHLKENNANTKQPNPDVFVKLGNRTRDKDNINATVGQFDEASSTYSATGKDINKLNDSKTEKYSVSKDKTYENKVKKSVVVERKNSGNPDDKNAEIKKSTTNNIVNIKKRRLSGNVDSWQSDITKTGANVKKNGESHKTNDILSAENKISTNDIIGEKNMENEDSNKHLLMKKRKAGHSNDEIAAEILCSDESKKFRTNISSVNNVAELMKTDTYVIKQRNKIDESSINSMKKRRLSGFTESSGNKGETNISERSFEKSYKTKHTSVKNSSERKLEQHHKSKQEKGIPDRVSNISHIMEISNDEIIKDKHSVKSGQTQHLLEKKRTSINNESAYKDDNKIHQSPSSDKNDADEKQLTKKKRRQSGKSNEHEKNIQSLFPVKKTYINSELVVNYNDKDFGVKKLDESHKSTGVSKMTEPIETKSVKQTKDNKSEKHEPDKSLLKKRKSEKGNSDLASKLQNNSEIQDHKTIQQKAIPDRVSNVSHIMEISNGEIIKDRHSAKSDQTKHLLEKKRKSLNNESTYKDENNIHRIPSSDKSLKNDADHADGKQLSKKKRRQSGKSNVHETNIQSMFPVKETNINSELVVNYNEIDVGVNKLDESQKNTGVSKMTELIENKSVKQTKDITSETNEPDKSLILKKRKSEKCNGDLASKVQSNCETQDHKTKQPKEIPDRVSNVSHIMEISNGGIIKDKQTATIDQIKHILEKKMSSIINESTSKDDNKIHQSPSSDKNDADEKQLSKKKRRQSGKSNEQEKKIQFSFPVKKTNINSELVVNYNEIDVGVKKLDESHTSTEGVSKVTERIETKSVKQTNNNKSEKHEPDKSLILKKRKSEKYNCDIASEHQSNSEIHHHKTKHEQEIPDRGSNVSHIMEISNGEIIKDKQTAKIDQIKHIPEKKRPSINNESTYKDENKIHPSPSYNKKDVDEKQCSKKNRRQSGKSKEQENKITSFPVKEMDINSKLVVNYNDIDVGVKMMDESAKSTVVSKMTELVETKSVKQTKDNKYEKHEPDKSLILKKKKSEKCNSDLASELQSDSEVQQKHLTVNKTEESSASLITEKKSHGVRKQIHMEEKTDDIITCNNKFNKGRCIGNNNEMDSDVIKIHKSHKTLKYDNITDGGSKVTDINDYLEQTQLTITKVGESSDSLCVEMKNDGVNKLTFTMDDNIDVKLTDKNTVDEGKTNGTNTEICISAGNVCESLKTQSTEKNIADGISEITNNIKNNDCNSEKNDPNSTMILKKRKSQSVDGVLVSDIPGKEKLLGQELLTVIDTKETSEYSNNGEISFSPSKTEKPNVVNRITTASHSNLPQLAKTFRPLFKNSRSRSLSGPRPTAIDRSETPVKSSTNSSTSLEESCSHTINREKTNQPALIIDVINKDSKNINIRQKIDVPVLVNETKEKHNDTPIGMETSSDQPTLIIDALNENSKDNCTGKKIHAPELVAEIKEKQNDNSTGMENNSVVKDAVECNYDVEINSSPVEMDTNYDVKNTGECSGDVAVTNNPVEHFEIGRVHKSMSTGGCHGDLTNNNVTLATAYQIKETEASTDNAMMDTQSCPSSVISQDDDSSGRDTPQSDDLNIQYVIESYLNERNEHDTCGTVPEDTIGNPPPGLDNASRDDDNEVDEDDIRLIDLGIEVSKEYANQTVCEAAKVVDEEIVLPDHPDISHAGIRDINGHDNIELLTYCDDKICLKPNEATSQKQNEVPISPTSTGSSLTKKRTPTKKFAERLQKPLELLKTNTPNDEEQMTTSTIKKRRRKTKILSKATISSDEDDVDFPDPLLTPKKQTDVNLTKNVTAEEALRKAKTNIKVPDSYKSPPHKSPPTCGSVSAADICEMGVNEQHVKQIGLVSDVVEPGVLEISNTDSEASVKIGKTVDNTNIILSIPVVTITNTSPAITVTPPVAASSALVNNSSARVFIPIVNPIYENISPVPSPVSNSEQKAVNLPPYEVVLRNLSCQQSNSSVIDDTTEISAQIPSLSIRRTTDASAVQPHNVPNISVEKALLTIEIPGMFQVNDSSPVLPQTTHKSGMSSDSLKTHQDSPVVHENEDKLAMKMLYSSQLSKSSTSVKDIQAAKTNTSVSVTPTVLGSMAPVASGSAALTISVSSTPMASVSVSAKALGSSALLPSTSSSVVSTSVVTSVVSTSVVMTSVSSSFPAAGSSTTRITGSSVTTAAGPSINMATIPSSTVAVTSVTTVVARPSTTTTTGPSMTMATGPSITMAARPSISMAAMASITTTAASLTTMASASLTTMAAGSTTTMTAGSSKLASCPSCSPSTSLTEPEPSTSTSTPDLCPDDFSTQDLLKGLRKKYGICTTRVSLGNMLLANKLKFEAFRAVNEELKQFDGSSGEVDRLKKENQKLHDRVMELERRSSKLEERRNGTG